MRLRSTFKMISYLRIVIFVCLLSSGISYERLRDNYTEDVQIIVDFVRMKHVTDALLFTCWDYQCKLKYVCQNRVAFSFLRLEFPSIYHKNSKMKQPVSLKI